MGSSDYTRIMKTVALRVGRDKHEFDPAKGGSRRNEERSRAWVMGPCKASQKVLNAVLSYQISEHVLDIALGSGSARCKALNQNASSEPWRYISPFMARGRFRQ